MSDTPQPSWPHALMFYLRKYVTPSPRGVGVRRFVIDLVPYAVPIEDDGHEAPTPSSRADLPVILATTAPVRAFRELTDQQAAQLSEAFIFEMVWQQVGERLLREVPLCEVRACRGCGCTQLAPCVLEELPCGWWDQDLCTACVARDRVVRGVGRAAHQAVLEEVRVESEPPPAADVVEHPE